MQTQEPLQDRRQQRSSARAPLAMTVVSLALLGGWVVWQLGPGGAGPTPPSAVSAPQRTATEVAAPLAAREAARVTTHGGMAELYAEREAAAHAAIEHDNRMGGMAERYREQELARRAPAP